MQLPENVTIPADQSEAFVPLNVITGTDIEWTEDLLVALEDGEGYLLGNSSSDKLHIQDDDPVDIEADDLPEEAEDELYNETNPGLYLLLNDDDDDEDGVIDGWESAPPGEDDEMVQAVLSFQSDEKIIGVSPNEQEAEVMLSLSSPRFRVWHNGQLLLGGPGGPTHVVLNHAALAGTMTVMVEFVPQPNPVPGDPYVEEVPFVPVEANLTMSASDVGPRATNSLDILALTGIQFRVMELTFAATDEDRYFDIHSDQGPRYQPPHWVDADLNGIPEVRHPVAYRREATMKLSGKFAWTTGGSNIQIAGDGPGNYDFFAEHLNAAGGVINFQDEAEQPFPDWIDHFNPMVIDWSLSPDGGATWVPIGLTKNQVYTLLDAPLSGTTLFHTVAHLATAPPAKGLTDPAAVVGAIWSQFSDRDVRRASDGHHLKYWDGGAATAVATSGLLSAGNGQCGSWAEFFIDAIRAHGILGAEKIYVESDYKDDAVVVGRDAFRRGGLLIKNWTFDPVGTAPAVAAPMTHRVGEYTDAGRVPAQGNLASPDTFFNHFVVRYAGAYYDPSYGIGPYASQAAWEDAALSGFDAAKLIGFDASGAGVYELFAKNNTPADEQTSFQAVPMSYQHP